MLSVKTSWNLPLRPSMYSRKLEPLLKGISLASLEPIVEKWSFKAFDKVVKLVIDRNTIQTQLPVTKDLPVLWEVSSLITCHISRGSVVKFNFFSLSDHNNFNFVTHSFKACPIVQIIGINSFYFHTIPAMQWWVFLNWLCQKRVCRKYSMQKSALKINECRAFSTLECQGICCIPISNKSLLGDRSVPFHLTSCSGVDIFLQTSFLLFLLRS